MSRQRSGLQYMLRAYKFDTKPKIQTSNDNNNTPNIITTDLLIHFNANNINSYPGSGTTWYNIGTGGPAYNATISPSNSPIFINGSPKSFLFTRNLLTSTTAWQSYGYFTFTRPPAISNDFTYCAWINTTNVGFGFNHYQLMYILSTETGGLNNDFGFGIDANGRLAYGDGSFTGSDITIYSTIPVNTGTWTFVAVTRQKSTGNVALYINGLLNNTGVCNTSTLDTANFTLIGSETDFPGYTWGGYIGAILGNTSILTPQQIYTNFLATKNTYGL